MSISFAEAKSQLDALFASKPDSFTRAELLSIFNEVSGKVESAGPHNTFLLYSGDLSDGQHTRFAASEMAKNMGVVTIAKSEVGKLLSDINARSFLLPLKDALAREINPAKLDFASLDAAEVSEVDRRFDEVMNGRQPDGSRTPTGIWDIASRKYVESNSGSWRVLAGANAGDQSILVQTELPALLRKTESFLIDGIENSLYTTGLDRANAGQVNLQVNKILGNAIAQTYLSNIATSNPISYLPYLEMTPDRVQELLNDKTTLVDGKIHSARLVEYMGALSPETHARYMSGIKSAISGLDALSKTIPVTTLARFGTVFGLLGLAASAHAAKQANDEGDPEEALRIMRDYAAEFAASEFAARIAGGVAVIGIGLATAAGVAISAPVAGLLVLGSVLLGGYFGGESVKPLLEYLNDRDNNGRIDVLDKLKNLVFGATWVITDPVPAELIDMALNLESGAAYKPLDLNYSHEDIVASAKISTAWRYALRELNSFVIEGVDYAPYNQDRSLDLFDPLTGEGAMTEEYLKDRAAMLTWKVRFDRGMSDDNDGIPFDGPKPYDQDWDTNSVQGNWDFVDHKIRLTGGAPLTLAIDGVGLSLSDHQIVFGSSKAEALVGEGDGDRMYGGGGVDTIHGRKGYDYIEGQDGNDVLHGEEGLDTLRGGSGDDQLFGGTEADVLQGDAGADELHGGTGDDLLLGGAGNDELHGDTGNDYFSGGLGADTLYGGDDNDYLFDEGGLDTNTLKGEAGNDILEIKGGTGIALLDGGADNDILIGGQGNNSLDGGAGNDSIKGGGDYDIINGGDDSDFVDAGGGNDEITGGEGADYLKGGAGSDTYNFDATNFGADLLEDRQDTDRIRIANKDVRAATYDADKMAWLSTDGVEIRKYDIGGSTLLSIGKSGDKLNTIYLRDWQPGRFGITLSGDDQSPARPSVATPALATRPENNNVDLAYTDAADGGSGNDILRGSDSSSVLVGGTGNDMIEGRDGDDWLEGGDDSDLIATGEGRDVALGGTGNDILRAGVALDLAKGVLTGTGLPALFWTATNPGFLEDDDTTKEFTFKVDGQQVSVRHPELAAFDLNFTAELDITSTLTSHLWWYDSGSVNASLEPSLNITVTLGDPESVQRDGVYTQANAPSSNLGKGKAYTLLLHGEGLLKPGTGIEGARLYGGTGDDVLYGANNNDKLYGEDDNDLLIGLDGDDELYGGNGKDEMSGGAGRDLLDGGDADDLLVGGYGADVLVGGEGNDKLVGDAILLDGTNDYPPGMDKTQMGGDYLQGGAGNDSIWGNHGDDYLFGGIEDDLVFGGEGDDHLFGEAGADTLSGGRGGDYLDGGAEKDRLYGDEGGDMLTGGSGDDVVHGDDGDDNVDGGEDNDAVFGDSGNDYVRGGAGNDRVYGDAAGSTDGADILEGGTGNDLLVGGGEADMYVFSKGDGQDVVNDDGADGSRNVIAFKFASGETRKLERVGNDLIIKYGADDQVTVKNCYGGTAFRLASLGTGDGGEGGEAQLTIAAIQFEDGVVWGKDEILAMAPAPVVGELPPDPFAGLESIYFVNALLMREQVKAAGKHALTFSFATSAPSDVTGLYLFDETQKQAVREALARFSSVLNLSFTEVTHGGSSDLSFYLDDLESNGLGGAAGYASPTTGEIHLNSELFSAQRQTETSELVKLGSLSVGSDGFEVLLHEIGHALGLKHPFEPPVLPNAENTTANTVMSYTSSGAPATALAAFDVAALQYLYGVATATGAGDDTHTFRKRWVQDSGGTDLFDAGTETVAVNVNLTPGSWIYRGEKASSILGENQAFIGFGTQIENATGGSGNDTLTGNASGNILKGGIGDDVLKGGQGNDTMSGGNGDDYLAGDEGDDTVQGSAGSDTYAWGAGLGNDVISELSSAPNDTDTLRVIGGLLPSDVVLTRSGNDLVLRIRSSHETMTVRNHYTGTGIERIVFDDNTQWDSTTILEKVSIALTDDDDYFQGSSINEIMDGLGGQDTLLGGAGNDTIAGGAGDDSLFGQDGDDVLNGGTGNDSLYGNAGDDVLTGGAGNDYFLSSGGSDTYVFGRGDGIDTIDYGILPTHTAIRLQPGVSSADLVVSSDAVFGRDLSLKIAGTSDSLTLKQFLTWGFAEDYVKQISVEFADGTGWTGEQTLQRLYSGTPGSDHLVARAGGSAISGGGGYDTLVGGVGNDTLDGGADDDSLTGGSGDDTLMNGETMDGGMGDDTYVVSGSTTIRDSGGADIVYLPAAATPSNVKVLNGLDYAMYLQYSDVTGTTSIRFDDYFKDSADSRVDEFRFGDGSIWTLSDIIARAKINNLTEGDDNYWVHGFGWGDNISAKGGNDYVHGLAGNDTINGGAGNDVLYGEVGDDTVLGGDGDDQLDGDDFDVRAVGNDLLDGGAGNDTLNGGKGDDVYVFGRQSGYDIVNEAGGNDRIVLDAGIMPANVTMFNDSGDLVVVLDGSRVQIRVAGHFGSASGKMVESIVFADGTVWDQVYLASHAAGPGTANQFTGTVGNDSYTVDHTSDWITEGVNQGVDSVTSSTSYALPDNVENLTLTGMLNLWAKGNPLANLIVGNPGDNRLAGGRGEDTLKGGVGDDFYDITIGSFAQGGAPSETTIVENANEGVDTVLVDNYDYTLPENVENLIAQSTWLTKSYPRTLVGNSANNVIDASFEQFAGARLDGGFGADTLIGGLKENVYVVDNALDVLVEPTNGGTDSVETSVSWTLAPQFENIKLVMGSGAISGTGNAADNVLDGSENSSANILTGGLGNDTYLLGVGDTAIEAAGGGNDTAILRTGVTGTYRVSDFANIESLSLGSEMGASTILGGAGGETLVGNGRRNLINGAGGDDFLSDQSAAGSPEDNVDTLMGGDGNDNLTSRSGADWLEGGQGDDKILVNGADTVWWAPRPTVRFQKGDGADVISGSRSIDISVGGWTVWDLRVSAHDSGYVLAFGNSADSITVQSAFQKVRLVFDDGTTVDDAGVASLVSNPSGAATTGVDFLRGTAGSDSLYGLAGDDTIVSGGGDDYVNGGDGADIMLGGAGLDVLEGGAGNDTLDGQAGNDIYKFARGDGADTIINTIADGSSDELQFAPGIAPSEVVATRSGSVDLRLALDGSADSILITGFLNAGAPIQLVRFADGTTWDRAALLNKLTTVTGTSGADTLSGSAGDDKLYGLDGNDWLDASAGNDTLDGGAGTDTLLGGTGDDTYVVDSTADLVSEFAGEGTDSVTSSATYTLGTNVENLTLTGAAALNATGNTANNNLTGNSGANRIDGGAGADTMIGGAGNDTYVVDNVGDVIAEMAAGGTDGVEASISYALGSEIENLTLTGTGAINGTGNSLNNSLAGNSGANRLDGDAGNDTMVGGAGNDTYVVDSTADVVTEAANGGMDTIESSVTWTLGTGVENLTLTGSANVNGTGNGVANTLRGNAGDNMLTGGAGNDTMIGGAGNDIYVMDVTTDVVTENAGEGNDTIQIGVTLSTLVANVENVTLTGTSNINVTGNMLANVLTGNSGANRIDGGAGADTMIGGNGNDIYVVENAGDVITEMAAGGTDAVEASISYTLGAEVENLTLTGTTAIDGAGNSLANSLTGNSGNNRLDGGAGNDTMVGGAGNDTFVVDSLSDVVTEASNGGTDTIESSITLGTLVTGVENLTLTGTANVYATGNSVANVLRGNLGDNILTGGAGNDTMIGGAGNDTYVLDVATDVVIENAGEGTDTIQIGVTLTALAANVENVTLTGTSKINATGNALANVLTGNSGANSLSGGDGDDTLNGGAGADTMVGGLGNDVFYVDSTADVVTESSGQGTDTVMSSVTLTAALAANVENLTLTGTSNLNALGNTLANIMTGNSGANNLNGGDGDDTLDGGAGSDTLVGGLGNDIFYVDSTSDVVTEASGQGSDTIMTSVTLTSLAANVENLTLIGAGNINGTGSSGDNVMTGNAGSNMLTGAAGNDTLDGKAGDDTLYGGAGGDTYLFGIGYGSDRIIDSDASAGVKDVVRFGAGIAQADIAFAQNGNALVATIKSTSEALTIQDWYLSTNNRVEEFRFNDGTVLTSVQAQSLVGAMASFSASFGGMAGAAYERTPWKGHSDLLMPQMTSM
ncbi:calcium-binding protein [Roseateles sp. DC23W]|uniref:Calcium-binding protein n=1 Tax=Pelomonas dachongensis TaxID=3299029 RepID=A0ABW7EU94_9BURK